MSDVRISEKKMRAVLRAGQLMSNICFNLAQRKDIPEWDREAMRESQKAWDAAYPKIVIKKKKVTR